MTQSADIVSLLQQHRSQDILAVEPARDGVPTLWVAPSRVHEVLRYLKHEVPAPYRMLYDLTAIDERTRRHRPAAPMADLTVVYHLLSFERNSDVRLKVPLPIGSPSLPTITDLWPCANWYEREAWDMLGITFVGHGDLRRILMPPWWQGHPLRKDHPARATDMPPFHLDAARQQLFDDEMHFTPQRWGLTRTDGDEDFMFLNLGPHHPGTHGVLRLVLQLRDEQIVNVVPDIGFHHRGAEKMGERQSWHTYIPYTDRVDYLSGVMNNLAYVLAVEKLANIVVPPRAQVIRVMMSELFRIISHLVWYGTFTLDLGAFSPVFYMFSDRERALAIVEAITGARMHPGWFRIGGVAQDLPVGWDRLIREFVDFLPPHLDEYDRMMMDNRILRARTVGVGAIDTATAVDWGMTGPNLRATGLAWDLRKQRPYCGYEQFEFDIPTAEGHGDCYDRAAVRVQEMRQSVRIIRQCLDHMPAGPYKLPQSLATPPLREPMLHDIETLITHFLGVSWGPVVPPGEAAVLTEGAKGAYSYYLHSDGNVEAYRTRIRTPSFPHIQAVPWMSQGLMVSDLIAILGSIDFVLADVDR